MAKIKIVPQGPGGCVPYHTLSMTHPIIWLQYSSSGVGNPVQVLANQ